MNDILDSKMSKSNEVGNSYTLKRSFKILALNGESSRLCKELCSLIYTKNESSIHFIMFITVYCYNYLFLLLVIVNNVLYCLKGL